MPQRVRGRIPYDERREVDEIIRGMNVEDHEAAEIIVRDLQTRYGAIGLVNEARE